jgi:GNAT superfamily N-acetyltransferase
MSRTARAQTADRCPSAAGATSRGCSTSPPGTSASYASWQSRASGSSASPARGSTPGSGLLPGLTGEIDALYVTPDARGAGTSAALAQAAIAEMRARGAGVIHNLICIEDDQAQAFWQAQGFERDMVCLSLYERS